MVPAWQIGDLLSAGRLADYMEWMRSNSVLPLIGKILSYAFIYLSNLDQIKEKTLNIDGLPAYLGRAHPRYTVDPY
jgi:hypothetical protein